MTEFAINVSVLETTKFTPFELNRGYMPSMLRGVRSDVVILKSIRNSSVQALQTLAAAHDSIIKLHVFQMHNTN